MAERPDTRTAIVGAAARLLSEAGPGAVTTRGVAEAAGVQAPAIYRLFGDKDGLLEAVAEHVLAEFVAAKADQVAAARADDTDPVADLRAGWARQVEFGLAHPAVFALLQDPTRAPDSPAATAGWRLLTERVHRIAVAGRLRVGEARAVHLVHAAGTGVVQTLLATPPAERDTGLADVMLEAVLARILTEPRTPTDDASGATDRTLHAAVAFRAVSSDLTVLSAAERDLLGEWLDRVVTDRQAAGGPQPAAITTAPRRPG